MPRSKVPPDLGVLHPRLREWMKQTLEDTTRPQRIVTMTLPTAFDSTTSVTTALTTHRIRHRLPQPPEGWKVLSRDRAGEVWQGRDPDRFYLYLRTDTAGITVKLEIS